jgi:hypothetical protein
MRLLFYKLSHISFMDNCEGEALLVPSGKKTAFELGKFISVVRTGAGI